ncbi:MAG: hypothetical protein ACO3BV_09190, partial [Ilumatobacteraceae bacterium]
VSAPMDPEVRARLLGLKLHALVREHFGDMEPDAQAGLSVGAASCHGDTAWVLIEERGERGLGVALAWASKQSVSTVHVLASSNTGTLARRATQFSTDVKVWDVDGISISPARVEELSPEPLASPSHLDFVDTIRESGADVVIEHGVVTGEVVGLEVCRVVDDPVTGAHRLEVGVGEHDREAFAMLHGDTPTTASLKRIVDVVSRHRAPEADPHPLNRLGAERALRSRVIANPSLVGANELRPVASPTPRPNLKDPIPCVAVGATTTGAPLVAVFSTGIDLDVVPFAADARLFHHDASLGEPDLVIVVPARDASPVTKRMADLLHRPATIIGV